MTDNSFWQPQAAPQQPRPPEAPQPMPPYAAPPQKKGKGWIVALAIIAAFLVVIVVSIASCTSVLSSSMSSTLSSVTATNAATVTQDSVVVIPINGTIQYDGTFSSPEGLKAQLDAAEENSRVKAVVLRVDSGGGVATAGEEMAKYVKDFSKPVVVSSASINASAAYEISSQAQYIYTAKTTAIGSIGTAMQVTDLSGLYEKLGINMQDITSSESKDSSYGTRPLSEEERAYYQAMVDQINQTFIDTVAEGRHMGADKVRELATGLTFTGMTGVENGLADEIGTLEDAVAKAASLANTTDYATVTVRDYASGLGLLDLLGSSSTDTELLARLKELEKNGAIAQ